jgi:hypothetical protein
MAAATDDHRPTGGHPDLILAAGNNTKCGARWTKLSKQHFRTPAPNPQQHDLDTNPIDVATVFTESSATPQKSS